MRLTTEKSKKQKIYQILEDEILNKRLAPTAVSSFPMAQQMDGDGELAAGLVVFTSGFAILTMFVWIFVLKQIGVI